MVTSKIQVKDRRNCPSCDSNQLDFMDRRTVRMEQKAEIQPSGCGCCSGTYLWQCSKCKNIEVF